MTVPTRLPNVTDPTANLAADPIRADVTMHDPDGREYVIRVTCGASHNVVPSAELAADHLGLDLGVTDWQAV